MSQLRCVLVVDGTVEQDALLPGCKAGDVVDAQVTQALQARAEGRRARVEVWDVAAPELWGLYPLEAS